MSAGSSFFLPQQRSKRSAFQVMSQVSQRARACREVAKRCLKIAAWGTHVVQCSHQLIGPSGRLLGRLQQPVEVVAVCGDLAAALVGKAVDIRQGPRRIGLQPVHGIRGSGQRGLQAVGERPDAAAYFVRSKVGRGWRDSTSTAGW